MKKWVAKFNLGDEPWGEEIRLSIEGDEMGFSAQPEDGSELDIWPAYTEEEALENMDEYFTGWDTYQRLD